MPKYLLTASYTPSGVQGVLKEGGTKRLDAVKAAAASVGATVEAAYWAFGDADFYGIVDGPSNAAMAAMSLTVSASGAVGVKTTVLLTAAEIDEAAAVHPSYRPPGA